MLPELPQFIDLKQLALQNASLTGEVPLAQLRRLHDSLCEIRGTVRIDWSFAFDNKQRPTIQGSIQTQLLMCCQRCLQPMQWTVDTQIALVAFNSEPHANEEILPGYEVITLNRPLVSLSSLIEDEIILALPIVAKHDICSNEYQLPEETMVNNAVSNPFQILLKLKK
jgi:uncharacterized protein